jgi:hypothetical protein
MLHKTAQDFSTRGRYFIHAVQHNYQAILVKILQGQLDRQETDIVLIPWICGHLQKQACTKDRTILATIVERAAAAFVLDSRSACPVTTYEVTKFIFIVLHASFENKLADLALLPVQHMPTAFLCLDHQIAMQLAFRNTTVNFKQHHDVSIAILGMGEPIFELANEEVVAL